jgi:hypothetical protein
MNKHFSLLLHSVLLIGALLPLSPIASITSITSITSMQFFTGQGSVVPAETGSDASEAPNFLAYGSGIPGYRGGGGTR